MNKTSFESCAMCKVDKPVKGASIGKMHHCCENRVLLSPNPEQYISSKNYEVSHTDFTQIIIPDISEINRQYLVSKISIFDSSPPGTISNSLYLDNSILLI